MTTTDTASGGKASERRLDDMLEATFPASDAPQLDGKTLGGDPVKVVPKHPAEHAPPPQVDVESESATGAFDRGRQTYALGGAGSITLSTEGSAVALTLSANRLTLDAASLEQLIAALERHRPSLIPR